MSLYSDKVKWIMPRLMREFDLTPEEAAAICGNLGHESAGFTALQEINPTVAGSKGGYGWAQWTGPRRRNFEAFCKVLKLSPTSDQANYAFLVEELKTTEKAAIPAVKKAIGLNAMVIAFEMSFERAGVKHYLSRLKYAQEALDVYRAQSAQPPPIPQTLPPLPAPGPSPGVVASGGILVIIAGGIAAFWDKVVAFLHHLF